jgi:cathepsin B
MQSLVVIVAVAASFGLASARVIVDRDPRMHISEQVNAMKTTWTAINNDAHKYKLGVASDAFEKMRRDMPVRILSPPSSGLPDSFDAREQWPNCASVFNDIRDQGQCGDCWAVSTAGAFSDRLCIGTNGTVTAPPYSSWDIATCSGNSNGCNGGSPMDAWAWIVSNGVVTGGPITNPVVSTPDAHPLLINRRAANPIRLRMPIYRASKVANLDTVHRMRKMVKKPAHHTWSSKIKHKS